MQRVSYIDQISGLLIVYMIVGHAFAFCDMREIMQTHLMQILGFFMFWFFYKSGMFYREKTCREITKQGGVKLLIPFLIFSILGHLADCTHQVIIGNFHWWYLIKFPIRATLLEGSVYGNLPLWFLPSLLAVQLLYAFLHRKIRDEWICLLGFIVAYATYLCEWNEPLYAGNISLGLQAYSMGHLLRDRQYKHTILLLAFIAYIVTFIIQPAFIDFRMNYLAGGHYPLAVMFGLSGCILVNNLFKRLSLRIRLLEYIGVRSMRYYVMHWMVLSVCSWTLNLSGWYLLVIMMGSCIILLPLAEKAFILLRLDWVFGLKKPIKKLISNS